MFKKSILFILSALAFQFACTSCSPQGQQKEDIARQNKEELRRQVLRIAVKHDADLQWLTVLNGRAFYTIELQTALFEPAGRPRLLIAPVVDVVKRRDAYFLTAHHTWNNDIYFQLRCDAQQAQYVLNTAKQSDFGMYEEYAIVMQPKYVHKPVAQLAGEIGDEDGEYAYAYVVHDAAEIVVVKGICLDILSLDGLGLDVEDLIDPQAEATR